MEDTLLFRQYGAIMLVQIDDDDLIKRSHREPLIVLSMGCTIRTQDAMLTLTASYGSQACLNLATLFSQQDHMYRSFC